MNFKSAMGSLSVAIMLAAYTIYIWKTLRLKSVRPHPFSWFLWGVVTGVVYLVQRTHGAGAGSWVVGLTAIICLLICALSLRKYEWDFSHFDWFDRFCVLAGLLVFAFYLSTKNPTWSAVLATMVDLIGYVPTVKKGWKSPYGDSELSFWLNSFKFAPSLLALESYSLATWLYPATLVVMNAAVALMLHSRRKEIGAP
jgi:hypothetical protein